MAYPLGCNSEQVRVTSQREADQLARELEPHVSGPATDAPAAGLAVDDLQAIPADLVGIAPGGRRAIQRIALVDHLYMETVVAQAGPQGDAAGAVKQRVRHEFAGQKPDRMELVRRESVSKGQSELPTSYAGRLRSARQLECEWADLIHVLMKLPRIRQALRGLPKVAEPASPRQPLAI